MKDCKKLSEINTVSSAIRSNGGNNTPSYSNSNKIVYNKFSPLHPHSKYSYGQQQQQPNSSKSIQGGYGAYNLIQKNKKPVLKKTASTNVNDISNRDVHLGASKKNGN